MSPRAWTLVALVAAALTAPAAAGAEPLTAELRTWEGQTWQLVDVTLVTFHSVTPHTAAAAAPPDALGALAALAAPPAGRGRSGPAARGRQGERRIADEPEPEVDTRVTRSVTLYRDGVATRVDLDQVATLAFFRHPIADSQLPPYMVSSHVRHGAVAILTDGSRVEGDHVALGSTVVRGRALGTQVAIPWTSIELLRFGR